MMTSGVLQKQRSSEVSRYIAALIDGDRVGIRLAGGFLDQVAHRGAVMVAKFFAEPDRVNKPAWQSFFASRRIQFVSVPRRGSSGDPNDVAIAAEVRGLLATAAVDGVALLVQDADYVPLAQEIVRAGKMCFVGTIRNRPGLAEQFKQNGAEVIPYPNPEFQRYLPKYMCTLHSDGSGSTSTRSAQYDTENDHDQENVKLVCSKLEALAYRSGRRDPLLPSVAKFWFRHGLGDLIVYPGIYATRSVAEVLRLQHQEAWTSHRSDLAFVFPLVPTSATHRINEVYGNSSCAERVRGGGPFVMRDSPSLVEEMLWRMRYMDGGMNDSIDEAIDVFLSLKCNGREIRKAGYTIEHAQTHGDKVSMIRASCLSGSFTGNWQMPPNDASVRVHLAAGGFPADSSEEVHESMAKYLRDRRVDPKKTYHARVLQYFDVYSNRRNDPCRRG